MSKLFPHIPFIADETPLSWAARQAAFHTGGRLVPFLNDLRIPAVDFARGLPEAVMRLCEMAGQDPAPVFHNTITAIGARRFTLRGHEFSAEFTTGVETRICPFCLAEDQAGRDRTDVALRHRLAWRLAAVRTCATHGVPLRDIRLGKWDDQLHELQGMGAAIETELVSPPDTEPKAPSDLQVYIERRLEGQTGPEWLDGQDIDQASRATEMLGGLLAFGPKQQAATMTVPMWDEAGRAGWKLVSEGEGAVSQFLLDTLDTSTRQEAQPRPKKAFGMLYSWLSASRLSKDPGPIRLLLRNVILENVPLVAGQNLLGEPVTEPRLSSINAIAKTEFIHPSALRNILQVAGLVEDRNGSQNAGHTVVDYARTRDLVSEVKYAVPVTQVPSILTTSRPVVAILIELGILARIQDHGELKSKVGKAIDGRSIKKLLADLREQFLEIEGPLEGCVPLAKSAERTRVSLKVILELLFGRHLDRVFRLSGHEGFGAIVVDVAEIKRVLESPPPGLSEDAYFRIP